MIGLLIAAAAQVTPMPPPPAVFGDYFPGPWIVFQRGDEPMSDEARDILKSVRDHLSRLPDARLALCLEGRRGSRREEKERRDTIRRGLGTAGRRLRYADDCRYPRNLTRPPGVILMPLAD